MLETQMSYTSDNTSVILSDVQTMQDDIKSTLEEEASLITDWDISLKSADFTDMTYTVSVSVVPKEYTEDTKSQCIFRYKRDTARAKRHQVYGRGHTSTV